MKYRYKLLILLLAVSIVPVVSLETFGIHNVQMMADDLVAKIKKRGFHEFKVRLTKSGKPFWTFSLEEVVREFSNTTIEGIER